MHAGVCTSDCDRKQVMARPAMTNAAQLWLLLAIFAAGTHTTQYTPLDTPHAMPGAGLPVYY